VNGDELPGANLAHSERRSKQIKINNYELKNISQGVAMLSTILTGPSRRSLDVKNRRQLSRTIARQFGNHFNEGLVYLSVPLGLRESHIGRFVVMTIVWKVV
jgi:hypothetical protein